MLKSVDDSVAQLTETVPAPPARTGLLAGSIVVAGVVLALMLALPGRTVATKYLNDLFIFLDGGYRLTAGQVPNVDFQSSLGPLAYLVAALGRWLGGSWGAAMPVGMAIVVCLLSLAAAHIVATRMRMLIGLPIALFLLLVAAAPVNTGESVGDLSFAMFYNRLGWSALGLLLIMYLPPSKPHRAQVPLDTACCLLLVLMMVYLKLTYGLVMLAFVCFMLLDRRQWRWPALTLLLMPVSVLLIELLWGGSAGYAADLRAAAAVSGNAPSFGMLAATIQNNLADLVLFALFAFLLLAGRRQPRDLMFMGFCAAAGVLIIGQNFQTWGIVSLASGAAVAAEALARRTPCTETGSRRLSTGALFLLAAFLLPAAAQNAIALGLHSALAAAGHGDPVALEKFDRIFIARLWHAGATPAMTRYNDTLRDGGEALRRLGPVGRVLVVDFVDPFSAGLGLQPARGESTWYHWDRTISDAEYPAPQDLFADVEVVMVPKAPVEEWTASGMQRLYNEEIAAGFAIVAETEFWTIYRPLSVDPT